MTMEQSDKVGHFVGHVSWLKGVVPVRSLTVPVSPCYFTAALVNNIQ